MKSFFINTNVRPAIAMICFMALGIGGTVIAISAFGDAFKFGWNAVIPFGSVEMVIVQVLAAAPLAWFLSQCISSKEWLPNRLMWVAVACGLLGVLVYLGPQFSELCRTLSPMQRVMFRPLLCLTLILPWAIAFAPQSVNQPSLKNSRLWAFVVVLAVFAWGGPAVYLTDRVPELARNAEQLIKRGQFLRAWQICKLLEELGTTATVANKLVSIEKGILADQLTVVVNEVSRTLAPTASINEKIVRARQLALLDQFESARQVLGSLVTENPAGALLLAAVEQQEEKWEASEHSCRRAIALLKISDSEKLSGPERQAMEIQAYDGLILSTCRRYQYQTAEALLLDAVSAVPNAAAHFHYRLAQQEELADRTLQAAAHFQKAAQIDPSMTAAVEQDLRAMKSGTSGCFLGPAAVSSQTSMSR